MPDLIPFMPRQLQSFTSRLPGFISNVSFPGNQGGNPTTRSSSPTMPMASNMHQNSPLEVTVYDKDGKGWGPVVIGGPAGRFS